MVLAPLVLTATIFARQLKNHTMANGQPYDPARQICAYNKAPLGTKLLVCGKSRCVRVTVTDRMRRSDRIDLSESAAKVIGVNGRAKVTVIGPEPDRTVSLKPGDPPITLSGTWKIEKAPTSEKK